MTHNILPSDIDFALKMLEANKTDSEIVALLVQRKVEAAKAARLVEDLRSGKAVFPEMSFEYVPPRKSAREHFGQALERVGKTFRLTSSDADERPAVFRTLLVIASLALAGAGVWAVANYRYRADTDSMLDDLDKATRDVARSLTTDPSEVPSPGFGLVPGTSAQADFDKRAECLSLLDKLATRELLTRQDRRLRDLAAKIDGFSPRNLLSRNQSLPPRAPVLEVKEDGLHVGKRSLTRSNALAELSGLLGSPTRTNQPVAHGKFIYAFDSYGILVYSQNGAETTSIVLDFEALGGTNGAAFPCSSALRVDEQEIGAETPPETLSALKPFSLTSPGAASGVFSGRYHNLGFCFAYFKRSQRLSLIEIDLD